MQAVVTHFRYPLLVTLLFIPSIFLPVVAAKSLWLTFNIICLVAGSLLMLTSLRRGGKTITLVATALFSAFNLFSVRALVSGSLLPLLLLIILLVLVLLYDHYDSWAGILGTLSFCVFQYGLLFMLFLNFWAIKRKRKSFLRSFWAALIFEVAISLILSPTWMVGWLGSFLQDITDSGWYASLLTQLIGVGQPGAMWLYLLLHLGLVLIVLSSASAFHYEDDQETTWVMALIMAVASLVVFPVLPGIQILCLPALIMVIQSWMSRWESHAGPFFWIILTILLVVPWVLAILPVSATITYTQGLLFASFGLVGLWWIRWWMMQPRY